MGYGSLLVGHRAPLWLVNYWRILRILFRSSSESLLVYRLGLFSKGYTRLDVLAHFDGSMARGFMLTPDV